MFKVNSRDTRVTVPFLETLKTFRRVLMKTTILIQMSSLLNLILVSPHCSNADILDKTNLRKTKNVYKRVLSFQELYMVVAFRTKTKHKL